MTLSNVDSGHGGGGLDLGILVVFSLLDDTLILKEALKKKISNKPCWQMVELLYGKSSIRYTLVHVLNAEGL